MTTANLQALLERIGFQLFAIVVFAISVFGWHSGMFDLFIIGYTTEALEANRQILMFCATIGIVFAALWAVYGTFRWYVEDFKVGQNVNISLMK